MKEGEGMIENKLASRKVKKMTNVQQHIGGKALHISPKGGKPLVPNADPSPKGY